MSTATAEATKQSTSALTEPVWAVIGQHYLNFGLTFAEARAEAHDLAKREQHAWIVTNEAARRMIELATGISVATPPDLRF